MQIPDPGAAAMCQDPMGSPPLPPPPPPWGLTLIGALQGNVL